MSTPGLTARQVAHYRTFGFVRLKGYLTPDEVGRLRTEVDDSLRAAYGDMYQPSSEVAPGLLLPTMTPDTPFAESLVAEDPRFWLTAQQLLERKCVPLHGEANCFYRSSSPHADYSSDVHVAKFMFYLESTNSETGALSVVPGSHSDGFHSRLMAYEAANPIRVGLDEFSALPMVAVDTEPGDAIVFSGNLVHGTINAPSRRLAWNVQYVAAQASGAGDHGDDPLDVILSASDLSAHQYDHDRWPTWQSWVDRSDRSGPRQAVLGRLSECGALQKDGFTTGNAKLTGSAPDPGRRWAADSI